MALTKVSRGLLTTSIVDNGNATAITIDSSENVGIGGAPDSLLHVSGVANLRIAYNGTSANYMDADTNVFRSGNGVTRMSIASDGSISIPNQDAINEISFTGTEFTNIVSATTSGFELGTTGAGYLRFLTNNSERMRIDGSTGNVRIGGTSNISNPYSQMPNFTDVNLDGTWGGVISFKLGGVTKGWVGQRSSGNADMVIGATAGQELLFYENNVEAMRISSGNLSVGTTSGGARFRVTGAASSSASIVQVGTNGYPAISFNNTSGVQQGYIVTNASSVSLVSVSDQRLKQNIADADDAGSKLDAIQVRQFDWIADGSHQEYGMVAQELQIVAPEAVHQPADSEEMMGVDYSKLVPMLVKEIQSLRTRVQELENNQ